MIAMINPVVSDANASRKERVRQLHERARECLATGRLIEASRYDVAIQLLLQAAESEEADRKPAGLE